MEADIEGAVREISSSNGLAPFSSEALTFLKDKNPPVQADLNLILPPEESIHQPKIASKKYIRNAIDFFKPVSATKPDGLRPGHL